MKIQDLHKLKIVQAGNYTDVVEIEYVGFAFTVASVDGDGDFDSQSEALKAAALFRASYQIQKELKRLVNFLEPLEKDGRMNVPGLATLNGARKAIDLSENTSEIL